MNKILRHHFWLFESVFVLLAVLLLVQTSRWTYALWNPKPRKSITLSKGKKASSDVVIRRRSLSSILGQTNLFHPSSGKVGVRKPKPKPKLTKKKPLRYTTCVRNGKYRPSRSRIHLKGTVVASVADASMAAIYDSQRGQELWVNVGDSYRGLVICSITQGRLTWLRQGRLEFVELNNTPHVLRKPSKQDLRMARIYVRKASRYRRYARSYHRSASRYERLSQLYPRHANRYARYAENYRRRAERYRSMAQSFSNKAFHYRL